MSESQFAISPEILPLDYQNPFLIKGTAETTDIVHSISHAQDISIDSSPKESNSSKSGIVDRAYESFASAESKSMLQDRDVLAGTSRTIKLENSATNNSNKTNVTLDSSELPPPSVRAPPRRKKKKNRPIPIPPDSKPDDNDAIVAQQEHKMEIEKDALSSESKPIKLVNQTESTQHSINLAQNSKKDKIKLTFVDNKEKNSNPDSTVSTIKNANVIIENPKSKRNSKPVRSKGPYRIPTVDENMEVQYNDFVDVNEGLSRPDYTVSHLYYMREHSIAFDPKSRWKKLKIWQMPRISLV